MLSRLATRSRGGALVKRRGFTRPGDACKASLQWGVLRAPYPGALQPISPRQLAVGRHLGAAPGFIPPQLLGHQAGYRGRDLGAGAGVEEKGAGAPGEDVLDGTGHLVAGGPDDVADAVGKGEVEGLVPAGPLGGEAFQ